MARLEHTSALCMYLYLEDDCHTHGCELATEKTGQYHYILIS